MSVLAVIPARSGSKGIPGKNNQKIGALTLVEWAIRVARDCKVVDETVVSSDEPPLIDPYWYAYFSIRKRPAHLATDDAEMGPVIVDALQWSEATFRCQFDRVVILQPTTPFRSPKDLAACVDLLGQYNSVCTITDTEHPLQWLRTRTGRRLVSHSYDQNRQKLEYACVRNGAVYGATRDQVLTGCLFAHHEACHWMPPDQSFNINGPKDLEEARQFYEDHCRNRPGA